MAKPITPEVLAMAALIVAQRHRHQGDITHDKLVRIIARTGDSQRELGMQDESRLSVLERLTWRALQASDMGADGSTFWRTVFDELRAWFDANPIPACPRGSTLMLSSSGSIER
jgi:hypothetical protein